MRVVVGRMSYFDPEAQAVIVGHRITLTGLDVNGKQRRWVYAVVYDKASAYDVISYLQSEGDLNRSLAVAVFGPSFVDSAIVELSDYVFANFP